MSFTVKRGTSNPAAGWCQSGQWPQTWLLFMGLVKNKQTKTDTQTHANIRPNTEHQDSITKQLSPKQVYPASHFSPLEWHKWHFVA